MAAVFDTRHTAWCRVISINHHSILAARTDRPLGSHWVSHWLVVYTTSTPTGRCPQPAAWLCHPTLSACVIFG